MLAIYFREWARTVVIITQCQRQKYYWTLANKTCWVKWKSHKSKKEAKAEHCWKQIRTFSTTIECDNTRRALLETWKYGRL